MRLGIDFGTTRTVVAAAIDGRYPIVSFDTEDGFVEHLPGLATRAPDGMKFGTDVPKLWEGSARERPLVRSVKAAISTAHPDELIHEVGGGGVSALSLTTDYLRYVRRMVLEHSNLELADDEPLEAMVAVPAHASTRQRYLTLEAFQAAGFTVLGLLNEPTAGAIEYARNSSTALSKRSPKRYVLVYDLGGGTFDTAAVSLVDRRFDLIGAEGIAALGGNDFDQIIADHVLLQCEIDAEALPTGGHSYLLERCRQAKETLSNSSRKFMVDVADLIEPPQILLDVVPIYDHAAVLVTRTIETVERLMCKLKKYGIDPDNPRELGAVYLVGGSVQFPAVQRALRKRFGRKVQLAPQPHAATAIGLAIAADPQADIFVREAPTRHFGVWREGEAGREKVFDPIIQKREDVTMDDPLVIERRYRPAHRVGRLRFVECTELDERGSPTGEVTPWESILFPYDPELFDHPDLEQFEQMRSHGVLDEEISETYEYTKTGIIQVTLKNRTRGYERSYVLGRGAMIQEHEAAQRYTG